MLEEHYNLRVLKPFVPELLCSLVGGTLNIEVRKHNIYTGEQDVVTHTEIKFVRIDDDNNPIPISERVKKRYKDRIGHNN